MAKKPDHFGLACRQLRAAHDRTMADQAKAFNCTPSFISQIETGRRPVPAGYVKQFAEWLYLPEDLEKQLEDLAYASRKVVRIYPTDEKQAALASHFGQALKKLPDKDLDEIRAIIERPRDRHTNKEITNLAHTVKGLFKTDDLLREFENFLAQLDPEAYIKVLPQDAKTGKMRGYSSTAISQRPHVALREDIYLGASDYRSDARKTLVEEFAHFILHRRRKPPDGGTPSERHRPLEYEVDIFLIEFFLPKADAEKFDLPEQVSRLKRIPLWLAQKAMAHHGRWRPPNQTSRLDPWRAMELT
jgi:HTH-type transcriptional regulator, competence development regulator